jgi:hypothetical protein
LAVMCFLKFCGICGNVAEFCGILRKFCGLSQFGGHVFAGPPKPYFYKEKALSNSRKSKFCGISQKFAEFCGPQNPPPPLANCNLFEFCEARSIDYFDSQAPSNHTSFSQVFDMHIFTNIASQISWYVVFDFIHKTSDFPHIKGRIFLCHLHFFHRTQECIAPPAILFRCIL